MTDKEIEELIYGTVAGAAVRFLRNDRADDPLLPLGLIEDAVKNHVVGIARMASVFEGQLRAMIPMPNPDYHSENELEEALEEKEDENTEEADETTASE